MLVETRLSHTSALVERYKGLAFVTGHAALLVVLLNLLLAIVFWVRDVVRERQHRPVAIQRALESVHPGLDSRGIDQLLGESSARPLVYEPFTGYRERPFAGRYVNVHRAGFRISTGQGPWPLDRSKFNVFVFGGSTAFGYGVADDETIASFLGRRLSPFHLAREPRVYNFGRAAYYSDHERILFEQLLIEGAVPCLAIFVDGLNDSGRDEPFFTARLREIFNAYERPAAFFLGGLLAELPMGRAVAYLRRPAREDRVVEADLTRRAEAEPGRVARVIDRYLANKALIEAAARQYGVSVAFVWQPVPVYKYDLKQHLFWGKGYGLPRAVAVYERMAALQKGRDLGAQFLWCADLQESLEEPLYVDPIHYSGRMSDRLAALIAALLVERRLLPDGA